MRCGVQRRLGNEKRRRPEPTLSPKKVGPNNGDTVVKHIVSLVSWFCRQLSLDELFIAAAIILDVLNDDRPDIKCKNAFRLEHPNYRKYDVDPEPPLTECPSPSRLRPSANYKQLLKAHQQEHGEPITPVRRRKNATAVPNSVRCVTCHAPAKYLYYNDGRKRSQIRCKVCHNLFQVGRHHRPSKAKYWCPICGAALYRWKTSEPMTIYKCPNDNCPRYLSAKARLNPKERQLQSQRSSQFKLHYQYREYHFDPRYLTPASPQAENLGRIDRIHNSFDTLGLALTFSVSCGLSARKTAYILKNVFQIPISFQTVLNYQRHAAVLCHRFNLHHKAPVDPTVAGDEAYIRIDDAWHYTWFTIGADSRAILAYHLADTRSFTPAAITLRETIRTLPENATIDFVADGNPAYDSAIHYLNQLAREDLKTEPLKRLSVIGLTNEDQESTQFRPFKQIIERLNRTYRFHTRAACGFKDRDGALALTVLFVTHYNHLRPHSSLHYNCPVPIKDLNEIRTLQGRWGKILHMAAELPPLDLTA